MLTAAERLLQSLGITEPEEIDLEAIAYYLGAQIRFRPLDGCEARIIGVNDRAIITVNIRGSSRRKRFSVAHELGHWQHHRGRALVCRVDEYRPNHASSAERIANSYAADLLMPHYLFGPLAAKHSKLTIKVVATLAEAFQTSLTSTAIRLIDGDFFPAFVVCHGLSGRKWFARAPSIPSKWFPRDSLDADSFAMNALYSKDADTTFPRKIGAAAWFDRIEAERYEILEQTIRIGSEEILTILNITDPKMLQDDDQGYARKR